MHKHLKFSDVLGVTSARSVISILPVGRPPQAISKNTTGFGSDFLLRDERGG